MKNAKRSPRTLTKWSHWKRLPGAVRAPLTVGAGVLLGTVIVRSLIGANFYWTGDAPGGPSWNATGGGTNWSSGATTLLDPGIAPGASDDVIFTFNPENNAVSTVLGRDFSIKGLTFNNNAILPVGIGGTNTLTVGSDGITVNSGSGAGTISTNVAVGTTEKWSNNAGSTTPMTVSGVISGTSALTLQGTGSTSTASGSFVFTNANTYSGAVTLLNANTSLTLSGSGSLNHVSGINIGGGASLILDNTNAVAVRLGSTLPVSSGGGTIILNGNATSPVNEQIGALTVASGATTVSIVPQGQTTTLTINGLTRQAGGTINFSTTGVISLPGQSAGLIGPWATVGVENGGGALDFANVSGGNVVPFAAYQTGPIASWATTDNVQVNSAQPLTVNTTINSLYLTGAGIVTVGNSPLTLTISSGGIIANGGTQSYVVNNNQTMNSATLLGGTAFSAAATNHVSGLINTAPGVPDFVFNVAGNSAIVRNGAVNTSTGVLQVNAILTDNPQVVAGTFGDSTTSGSNVITLTSGTTSNIYPGATVTGLGSGYTGTQVVTGIIDSTHFTVGLNASASATGTPAITDHTGLTKTGGGILDLADGNNTSDINSFSGFVTVDGGTILVRADHDFGTVPATAVPNAITLNGGEIRSTAGFSVSANRGITVGPQGGTITYDGGSTFTALSKISGPGGMSFQSISNAAATTFNLSTASGGLTYLGPTTLVTKSGSNITFTVANELPSTTPLTIANFQGGFGTVNFNSTAQTIGSLSSATAVGTISNAGALTIGGPSASPVNLTAVYNGVIGSPATTATTLVKNGGGTQTFAGASTYNGTTTINGGTFLVTNTAGSATGTSSVVVANGGTLGGSGIITGAVTVNSGGAIAPAAVASSASTLQLQGGLTINAGAIFNFDLAAPNPAGPTLVTTPTSDNVFVTGATTLSAGTDVINVTDIGLPASILSGTPAIYQLITDTGAAPSITGVNFKINLSTLYTASVISDAANQSLDLQIVQNPNPSLSWFGSPPGGSGPWDTTSSVWVNTPPGSGSARYQDGANLTFDNTPGVSPTITVAGTESPGSMTFNNAASISYTFTGSGKIAGTTGFTSNGLGTINFNETNTFTGAAVINAGTVNVGSTGSLASSSYTIASGAALNVSGTLTGAGATVTNSGTFTVNSGASVAPTTSLSVLAGSATTFSNAAQTLASLSGAGPVTLNGTALTLNGGAYDGVLTGSGAANLTVASGIVTLSNGNNSYGNTAVTGGQLVVTNTSGSATGAGNVDVRNGATLAGNGLITGGVTVEFGGQLAPGMINGVTVGALTLGNVSLNGGAILDLGVGSAPVAVANTLTLQPGSPINLVLSPAVGLGAGTFPVFTASTLTNNNDPNFPFNVHLNGVLASAAVSGVTAAINGNEIDVSLAVSADPFFFTGAAGSGGSANWDFSSQNWSFHGSPITYLNGANVIFDDADATSGNNKITVSSQVNPASITINGTQSYTFSGTGFGGSASLTINNSGTVTLPSGGTFTGPTSVSGGGTVVIPNDSALGAAPNQLTVGGGSILKFASTAGITANTATGFSLAANRGVTLNGNSTLDISAIQFTASANNSNQLNTEFAFVYNGVISGSGGLIVQGAGGAIVPAGTPIPQSILDFGVPQTYSGDTTINDAVVQVNSGTSGTHNGAAVQNVLPTATTLNLVNHGVFNIDSVASGLSIAGLNGDSTGFFGTTNASIANAATLTFNGSGSYSFTGTIGPDEVAGKSGAAADILVAKTGSGTQVLGGNNTYTGATTVSGGNLVITGSISGSTANVNGGMLSGTGTVGVLNVNSGGTVQPGGVNGSGAGTGGTLSVGSGTTGNFALTPGGTFTLAIVGGSGSSDAFGQLSVAGAASLAGAFADAPLSLGNSDVGDVFLAIVDANSAVTGTFSNDPGNNIITLPNGDVYQVFYDVAPGTPTLPGSGNDVAVELLVPEPGSLGTVLSGIGVFAGLSRYRGRRKGNPE